MKKTLKMVLLAAVIAVAVASCSDRPKVIPARKMEKIYREMFMADQWIITNPEKKRKADTTWLYVPIFEKYGYVSQMTDRIDFKRNKRGAWYPEPVVEDTVFRGPELIIKDTSSVVVEEHDPTEDLRIWRR